MLLGFLVVRPVPLPEQASSQFLGDGDDREPALSPVHIHSRTPLLNGDSIKDRYVRTDITDGEYSNSVGGIIEATRSVQVSIQKHCIPLNVHGKALLGNLNFWLLFSISSMRMFPFSAFLFYLLISYITRTVLGTGYTCMF